MNKQGLIKKINQKTNKSQMEVTEFLHATLECIEEVLQTGDSIIIQGFGRFTPVKRAKRNTTNPQTHEVMVIDECMTVRFKPGKTLKDKINEIQPQKQ